MERHKSIISQAGTSQLNGIYNYSPQLNGTYNYSCQIFPSTSKASPGLTFISNKTTPQNHSLEVSSVIGFNEYTENKHQRDMLHTVNISSTGKGPDKDLIGHAQNNYQIGFLNRQVSNLTQGVASTSHSNAVTYNPYHFLQSTFTISPSYKSSGTVKVSSTCNVPSATKALNGYAKNKYQIDMKNNVMNVKHVSEFNPEIAGQSNGMNYMNSFQVPYKSFGFFPSTSAASAKLISNKPIEIVKASSTGNVPNMKDLNGYAKSKYQTGIHNNFTNVKRVLKSNQEVGFYSGPKNIHRIMEKRPHCKETATKDSKASKKNYVDKKQKKPKKESSYSQAIDLEYDKLFNADLLPTIGISMCPVCFLEVAAGQGVTLQDCLHSFCKKCLTNAVQFSETALVKCPMQIGDFTCKNHMKEREVKALVSAGTYKKYLQRSIALAESQAENSFHCKTPNCPGWCLVEGDVDTFQCPACKHINCITCSAVHEGETCDQYLYKEARNAIGHHQLVTPEIYDGYLQRKPALAKSQDENIFHCKTSDCPGQCFIEDYFNLFRCPACRHTNCITCSAIHEGKSCNQYLDEEARKALAYLQSELQENLKIEFEGKGTYDHLLALDDIDLVANAEKFECPICFVDIDPGQGAILRDCLHSFCKECLANAVKFSETVTVQCPFLNDEYRCESHLQEREVKAVVSPEIYEKYLQRSVTVAESQAQNSFHCKTPDCLGWYLVEDDINIFQCPVCKRTNCITCAAVHEGMNCRQYQDDVAFRCDSSEEARRTRDYLQKKITEGKAMKCPKCQIILMKRDGCDSLLCSMCRTEICWATRGPRWGPGGRGDYSGGCKCLLNGKYCHPLCKGCH